MSIHAATGDTWGVPGPTFLLAYLTLAAVLVAASLIHRRRLFAGPGTPGGGLQPGPQQAAYLNGGGQLAVYTALGGLRAAGAIGVARGALVATGPLPAGVTPLDTAIHHAARQQVRVRDLERDHWVAGALDELRGDLERAGLAVSGDARRVARWWPVALLALAGLGAARVVAGMANDRPVEYLAMLVVAVTVVAVVQLRRRGTATRAGTAALFTLRTRNAHLAPTASPAYATYGAAGAAMGVALFGAASLWALDPAFAAESEIQRQYASGASGGSGTYGDSGGGDSGGGSSCGGGGGCGGGGCGG